MSGVIPQPPTILVRDEKIEQMVRGALHRDFSRMPAVIVYHEWPEDWRCGAVVITPINVIGTEGITSFGIKGSQPLTDRERGVLDAYIRIKRASGGGHVAYRDIAITLNTNRRDISYALKGLEKKNIGVIRQVGGFELDIGVWRPDAAKARALGIEITEY